MKGIPAPLTTIAFVDNPVDFTTQTSTEKNMAVFPAKPLEI